MKTTMGNDPLSFQIDHRVVASTIDFRTCCLVGKSKCCQGCTMYLHYTPQGQWILKPAGIGGIQ